MVAGCGRAIDPETSLLAPGSLVVVASKDAVPILPSTDPYDFGIVEPGVRATVGHDPGGKEGPSFGFRDIIVTIETGARAGHSGRVTRKYLRPIPER